tara:strand:+ start:1378 stop:2121 length:744 start_codon:yes stop_codon:yes gene_type:complete
LADQIFSEHQIKQLSGILDKKRVKDRKGGFSYLEGWEVIDTANKVFGFGNWSRTTKYESVDCTERKFKSGSQGWQVTYIATVEITVCDYDGRTVTRTGCGAGVGMAAYVGEAHEGALKEAETDATKRALATFGNQFGLALYDKTRAQVGDVVDETATPTQAQEKKPAAKAAKAESIYGAPLEHEIKKSWILFLKDAPPEWLKGFVKAFATQFETGNRKVSEEITHNLHAVFCQEYVEKNPIPEAAAK